MHEQVVIFVAVPPTPPPRLGPRFTRLVDQLPPPRRRIRPAADAQATIPGADARLVVCTVGGLVAWHAVLPAAWCGAGGGPVGRRLSGGCRCVRAGVRRSGRRRWRPRSKAGDRVRVLFPSVHRGTRHRRPGRRRSSARRIATPAAPARATRCVTSPSPEVLASLGCRALHKQQGQGIQPAGQTDCADAAGRRQSKGSRAAGAGSGTCQSQSRSRATQERQHPRKHQEQVETPSRTTRPAGTGGGTKEST